MAKDTRLPRDLEKLGRGLKEAAHRGLLGAGHILEAKIVIMLSQPGHGRLYTNRGPGRGDHRASAPGEPPAVDTNRLRGDIKTVDESTATKIHVRTGTNVEYGPELEFGRRNMAPRPFMRPALGMAKSQMRRAVVKALREGMGEALRRS